MNPIKPMLAVPEKRGVIADWNDWAFEEKYDGHRLIVHVGYPEGHTTLEVNAFARPRGDGRMIMRELPEHIERALATLPVGWYDGELMVEDGRDPWQHTDVVRLDLQDRLTFVVFDVLTQGEANWTRNAYRDRRQILERIFNRGRFGCINSGLDSVRLAPSLPCKSERNVRTMVKNIWSNGGEGGILKRLDAVYTSGKRSPDFIKLKKVQHAALTLIGFEATKGTVMNRGSFAMCKLRDDQGNETSCKTLDDHELARIEKAGEGKPVADHPWVGKRKLMIEFNKRTRTGGYEGPVRWDRWEDE